MQSFEAVVVSNKMQNTVVVVVSFTVRHRKYGKIIKRTTKIHAHNENVNLKIGDKVTISACRPFSKTVHFQVVKKTRPAA